MRHNEMRRLLMQTIRNVPIDLTQILYFFFFNSKHGDYPSLAHA